MDKIESYYSPPKACCELPPAPGDEPFTKEEAWEIAKAMGGFVLASALLVAPFVIIGKVIEELEFGGFEGLELPEPKEEAEKPVPKSRAIEVQKKMSSSSKLPLPKTFRLHIPPKHTLKTISPKKVHRVQHF